MKFSKMTLPVLLIIMAFYSALPGTALSEEGGGMKKASPAAPVDPTGHSEVEDVVVKPVDQSASGSLTKTETDRAEFERKLIEAAAREQQMRDEVARLTAEKDAIEKACTAKEGEDAKPKSPVKAKKKKSINKWWVTGDDTSKRKASSGSKAGKSSKSKKTNKIKTTKTKKPVQLESRKSCNGSPVSMDVVKKALKGDRKLAGKNLNGLNLAGMDFTRADLKGACLLRTNLERANLAEADLERADMSGANLDSASLRLANINAVKLDGASLAGTIWPDSRVCLEGSIGICRDVIP